MKRIILSLIILSLSYSLKAQNLFPFKLDNCPASVFCLDCGDEQANVKPDEFDNMIAGLNKSNDYSKLRGKILLQVLIDSAGNACVLSHTDRSNSPATQNIVAKLNAFKGWLPAKTKGKTEGRTSINLLMEVKDGVLSGKIQRVDQAAFFKSFDHPTKPEIYNKDYVYKNENLKNYTITVWNSENSNLPNNFDNDISIDKDNMIWLTVDQGLVKFDGKSFTRTEQDITNKRKYFGYNNVEADNNNWKWVYAGQHIYSYDNNKWAVYDPKVIGIGGTFKIVNNKASGEVFFCSDSGLVIRKNNTWSMLDKSKIKELPSNRVYFAKRDSKNRIWIGTFSGSVLIDENGKATNLNDTQTILNGKCITSMDEDENGNIYFGLYEYNRKNKQELNNDEGIAIWYANGDMKQFTTSNSGMPFNHVSKLLYDRNEKVLWIATDRAGLVRYDLKNGWENYHNDNSKIPTSYISDMAFDNNGILYLATRQGLVRVERNKN